MKLGAVLPCVSECYVDLAKRSYFGNKCPLSKQKRKEKDVALAYPKQIKTPIIVVFSLSFFVLTNNCVTMYTW